VRDAILARADVLGLTGYVRGLMGYVRDSIDLAPLIRSSTVSIVIEIVDGIRSCGVGVPWALEQTVDRLVLRWGL
jgi:PII-like signaling protein